MSVVVKNMKEYKNLLSNNKNVVADFHAEWCGPCKEIAPAYEKMALANAGVVVFCRVDVDEAEDVATEEDIQAMPTFKLYRDGVCVDTLKGSSATQLEKMIAALIAK